MPACSVVVATRDRPDALEACLDALDAQDHPSFEVIVVDNAPADDRSRVVAHRHGAAYVLEPAVGLSRARNRGSDAARAPVVAFIDDDAVPRVDWLSALTAEFGDPRVAAVAGRILPLAISTDAQRLYAAAGGLDLGAVRHVVDRSSPDWFERSNFGGLGFGGNIALRRGLPGFAGFRESLGLGSHLHGGEEHYALFDLLRRGYRVVYNPAAVVEHPYPETMAELQARHLRNLARVGGYATLLLAEEPGHRAATWRYLAEGLFEVPRHWRGVEQAVRPRIVSRARAAAAVASGVALYARSRASRSTNPPVAEAAGGELSLLVVTPDFPPAAGGIQILVQRLCEEARGMAIRVVTLAQPGARAYDERPRPFLVHRVPRLRSSRLASLFGLNAGAVLEGLRLRPDAVLCAHIVTSPAAWAISRILRVPFVQYLHADEVPAHAWLSRFALRRADAAIAVSRHTERLALEHAADASRLHRIPPGVDLPTVSAAPRDAIPTILTVARLEDRYKGHDTVLRALPLVIERVPEARWVVVGDGSLREELERSAAALGLGDRVTFTGVISDSDRDAWLRRAHVFVMPSRLPPGEGGEGFGIVYLEASAHGVPVVAGNVAGALDAVVDGATGLLVDPSDPVAVAGALADLLTDPVRAEAMGRAGAARARDFAWPRIAAQVEDVVRQVRVPA